MKLHISIKFYCHSNFFINLEIQICSLSCSAHQENLFMRKGCAKSRNCGVWFVVVVVKGPWFNGCLEKCCTWVPGEIEAWSAIIERKWLMILKQEQVELILRFAQVDLKGKSAFTWWDILAFNAHVSLFLRYAVSFFNVYLLNTSTRWNYIVIFC